MNGAEVLMEILLEQGVERVFGCPGAAVLPIYDALYRYRGRIRHVITAHEQGACHAADGSARLTGKTGVVLATSGPGATNLVTGIAAAYMDSSPLVAITGSVRTDLIGRDSFQEVYITGVTMPITKHNFVVRHAEELPGVLRAAFRIASEGRPGPVLVDIPRDIQEAGIRDQGSGDAPGAVQEAGIRDQGSGDAPGAVQEAGIRNQESGDAPGVSSPDSCILIPDSSLRAAAALLNAAKRPVIYFGGGAHACGDLLRALCGKTRAPAAHSLMAAGVLRYDDPHNLGMLGMHGRASANKAVQESNVLLMIGARLSDRVVTDPKIFAPQATKIQIDIDPAEINKNLPVEISITGDAKQVLEALLPLIDENTGTGWLGEIKTWQALDRTPEDDAQALKPHQILDAIGALAGEDAVYVTDVGQHQLWAAQYARHVRPRSFITSGGLGAMGFGYGAAIGAAMCAAGRPVVHITGDGSFHMNLNEACTAVSYRVPVITVIFNNRALGMVRQWQRALCAGRYSETELRRKTDYLKLAEGFGLPAFRCAALGGFENAFGQALKINGPSWIECVIDQEEQVYPMGI